MTIADIREKCKRSLTLKRLSRDVLLVGILVTVSGASFILGYLTGYTDGQGSATDHAAASLTSFEEQSFIATKYGSAYYPISCASARRIATTSAVYFSTEVAAQQAGYTLSKNCRGQ